MPPDQQSSGQNVVGFLYWFAVVAARLDAPSLDAFVVDRCELVEAALRQAGWREPDTPPAWADGIPIDDRPVADPDYLAGEAEYDRIVAQVDAALPWYNPADGLRTVRGLIGALEAHPELAECCDGGVWDLVALRYQLEYAERVSTRFHLWVSY
ncbi:MAG TPA: hypothetical protein VM597_15560 [Gemmataceae bacterium]|nr:hypothetical protein [Gemmataceae bacterium]